tara:strand:+ start:677 stop:1030 length:354 start_codon:yes stop_codon:yes gene_type:complete
MLSNELRAGQELREDLQSKGINISSEYVIKLYENSAEFILADRDGQIVFGGNVDVSGFINWKSGDREIKINKGSMGSFDMTCKASVESTLLMAEMIQNFEQFAESVEWGMDRVANQK